jgi:MYXO-CTERM domain-containing protein
MKKLTSVLAVFALSMALAISNPGTAQTADNSATTTQDSEEEDDDSGNWGLLGLLGLGGLLGLRKRDDHRVPNTGMNR